MEREDFLKLIGAIFLALGLALVSSMTPAFSDTGWEGATRKEVGSYIETASIAGSSVAGTALFAASKKRADGVYFNNTNSAIWVSSVSATTNNDTHAAILIGFPVLASSTFKLDGSMTGAGYFTCDREVAACQVRSLEGKVQ